MGGGCEGNSATRNAVARLIFHTPYPLSGIRANFLWPTAISRATDGVSRRRPMLSSMLKYSILTGVVRAFDMVRVITD